MTLVEKVSMLKILLGVDESDISEDKRFEVYLDSAKREILSWRYSYANEKPDEVPDEYEMTQIHAVIAGYSISGAENQISHSENGISRSFKYEDMVAYIRGHIIPIAKVI